MYRRIHRAIVVASCAAFASPLAACGADGGPVDARDTIATAPVDATTAAPDAEPDAPVGPPGELKPGVAALVTHVVDGDTLDVRVGATTFRVRMRGLDAPECVKGQKPSADGDWRFGCVSDDDYYGLAAYDELSDLVAGEIVVVTCDEVGADGWCPLDGFDRYLAYLRFGGRDVAIEMAWRGAAFAYTRFDASKLAQICAAEYDARDNGRGMWSAGSVAQVLAMMGPDKREWYERFHDEDCDRVLAE